MTAHQLVGYDPKSERVAYSRRLPDTALILIRSIFDEDDPEGAFTYKIDYSAVSDLSGAFETEKPPRGLEYFIEPYP
jgi:hypothetical protein